MTPTGSRVEKENFFLEKTSVMPFSSFPKNRKKTF
jgi:hypothetical protein